MIGGVFDYCINGDENGLNQSFTGERRLRLISKCLNDHVPTPHDIPFWQQVYLHESAIFQVTHGKIFCAWTLAALVWIPLIRPHSGCRFCELKILENCLTVYVSCSFSWVCSKALAKPNSWKMELLFSRIVPHCKYTFTYQRTTIWLLRNFNGWKRHHEDNNQWQTPFFPAGSRHRALRTCPKWSEVPRSR